MFDLDTKRNAVVRLHFQGKNNLQIRQALPHMKMNENFVKRTIKRFLASGSIKKRYGGGVQRTATSSHNVELVRLRSQQISTREMAKEIHISPTSVRRILKRDLQVHFVKDIKRYEEQHKAFATDSADAGEQRVCDVRVSRIGVFDRIMLNVPMSDTRR